MIMVINNCMEHHNVEHRRAIDRVARDVAAFLTASCVGKVVLLHDNGDQ